MKRTFFAGLVGSVVVALLAGGCAVGGGAVPESAKAGKVTGQVYYLLRIMLPEETTMSVELVDVTDAAKPKVIGKTGRVVGGQAQIPFEISFRPDLVREGRAYQVRAELLLPGGQKWGHTQAYPVLTGGAPAYVEVRVNPLR